MAQRRMFSKSVIRTDSFLDMPQTAQNLYFHLGIEADDDGFISPRFIMRTLGSQEDDLKILIAKKFVIPFESGVIVITHWKENNYIQKDRKHETIHQLEMASLSEDSNGVYKMDTECIQDVRLGKDRLGEGSRGKDTFTGELKKIIEYWNTIKIDRGVKNDTVRVSVPIMRQCIRTTDILENIFRQKLKKYSVEEMKKAVDNYAREICLRDSSSNYKEHRFFLNEFLKQSNGLEKFILQTEQDNESESA